jgi:TonB-linked SusC/RagA family outer membrane protein
MPKLGRWSLLVASGVAVVLTMPATHPLVAQGTITGRVTSVGTAAPLSESRVLAISTTASAITGPDGRFTLRNVPAGTVELQVLHVGFTSQKKRVVVTSGSTTNADFELEVAVVQLEEIVTTATGQQRRVELGNALATLGDVGKKVEQAEIHTIGDLMVAKAAGVQVLPPIMTGGAPTVRIRGLSSISLTNAPIWIVDGIRYEAGTTSLNGQTSFSMLNSLSPDEIEDIEIVKGPSAATLYGTNASNGVVVVTTKKGRAGNTQWTFIGERGVVSDRNDYQTMYASWGHAPGGTTPLRCKLATMVTPKFAGGNCIQDSLTSYNLMKDKDRTFVHDEPRSLYGVNVSGGNDAVRYFASGEVDDEFGPVEMPAFEIQRFNAAGIPVRKEWLHPEAATKMNFRANLSATVSPTFDVSVSTGFARNENRLPPSGSAFEALYYVGMQNYGFKGPGLDKILKAADSVPLNEYFQYAPGDVMQRYRPQIVQRMTMGSTANWRPMAWLANELTVGVDLADRDNSDLCRLGECAPTGVIRLGAVSDAKNNNRTVSAKLSSTASWNPRTWANFKTSAGADYIDAESDAANSSGVTLPPGGSTVGQAATRDGGQTWPVATKTLGLFIQEQGSFRDRMFLTLAVRTDQNSAFGTKFQSVKYPKASLSWLLSDESFFPKWAWMNSFRARSAYGASGVQPGRTDGLATFTAGSQNLQSRTGSTTGSDVPALAASQALNADLRPETSKEFENGFETQLLNNRVRFDYTYYVKKTKDALINVDLPPSSGAAQLSPLRNIGATENSGHEVQLNVQLLDRRRFGWDVTMTASHESNKVVDLGIDPVTGQPRILNNGSSQQQRAGYPINGRWGRPYSYSDANGDGIIQSTEVRVDTGFVFFGYAFPRDLFSIQNGIDLFSRRIRINALFDYRGGFSLQDGGNNFQCNTTPFACREIEDPTSPLWLQARGVAKDYGSVTGSTTYKTSVGYLMNGQFWKFRELSVVYNLPQRATQFLRSHAGSNLVFGARNLHTWTSYTGLDPEEHDAPSDTQSNFQSAPPPTYFTLRLNLKY